MITRVVQAMNNGYSGAYEVQYKTWVFGKWISLEICQARSEAQKIAKLVSELQYVLDEYKYGRQIK